MNKPFKNMNRNGRVRAAMIARKSMERMCMRLGRLSVP